jgi:hypothetical protein
MKTDCPHCGRRIRWWHYVGGRPAAGERRFLPNRAVTVCPFCRGGLATNVHPLEHRLDVIVLTPAAIALILLFAFPGLAALWIPVMGSVLVVMVLALGCVHSKTRDW